MAVKKTLCIRCGECARACPVHAICLDPAGEPFVCIHCGRCVEYCLRDCLEMVEVPVPAADDEGREEVRS